MNKIENRVEELTKLLYRKYAKKVRWLRGEVAPDTIPHPNPERDLEIISYEEWTEMLDTNSEPKYLSDYKETTTDE